MVNRTLVMCNKERKGKRERGMERKRKEREATTSLYYKERAVKRESRGPMHEPRQRP